MLGRTILNNSVYIYSMLYLLFTFIYEGRSVKRSKDLDKKVFYFCFSLVLIKGSTSFNHFTADRDRQSADGS